MQLPVALFLAVCAHAAGAQSVLPDPCVLRDTLTLLDTARQRPIPIAIYHPVDRSLEGLPVIIFSHGHNANHPGTYLLYRWLLEPLAQDGHVVVSVQHELPGDSPLAMSGDIHALRRPSWERGVANLHHVVRHLHRTCPQLDFDHLTVMGHSHGGDISMLLATEAPALLDKVISLDSRRVPLPRTSHPRVCSIRSVDQPADEGVLPTPGERALYRITVLFPAGIGHNDMGNRGTPEEQQLILELVRGFLAGP